MLRAGRLSERITIQGKTLTKNDYHEQTETWTDTCTVSASVRPQSAGEQVSADRLETQQRFLITIRHRNDVTVKNRIKHVHANATRYYDIVSITDRGMRGRALDIIGVYEQDNG